MKKLLKIPLNTKRIFLDFDGVLVDSNKFKEIAIEKSIKFYEKDFDTLFRSVEFFNANAGIARRIKLMKFFDKKKVNLIMHKYSNYCKEYLLKASLTKGSEKFIIELKKKHPYISLYILSGAEKNEISNFLIRKSLNKNFSDLLCSEKTKIEHLNNFRLSKKDIFIGDSNNDLKVSKLFPLSFILVSDFGSSCSSPKEVDQNDIMGSIKNLSCLSF